MRPKPLGEAVSGRGSPWPEGRVDAQRPIFGCSGASFARRTSPGHNAARPLGTPAMAEGLAEATMADGKTVVDGVHTPLSGFFGGSWPRVGLRGRTAKNKDRPEMAGFVSKRVA